MLQRLQREVRRLLSEDDRPETVRTSRGRRILEFWVTVGRSFVRNRCPVRASALAYSSLLAFIPLLALVIGISTSVLRNDEARISGWINEALENLVPQLMKNPEVASAKDTAVAYIQKSINNVQSGTLGTTGVIAFLLVILFMLSRIEETLNDIWGVATGRSWYARLVNYWAAISLGPIVVFAALGFSTSLRILQVRTGKPTLTAGDLVAPAVLIVNLKEATSPGAEFLRRRLSIETRDRLEAWEVEEDPIPPRELVEGLLKDLNAVVGGPAILSTNAEPGMEGAALSLGAAAWREQTRAMLHEAPTGERLLRWNRMVLEDLYPRSIRPMSEGWLENIPLIGSLLLRLIPVPILGGACAVFYALMPNTKVRWNAALVGGLVAGLLWVLNNELSVRLVSQVSRDHAIYSSLASLPVFMAALYFFWLLLLFGAQVAYTFQNRRSYVAAREVERVHQDGRERVALRIMVEAARAFAEGTAPPTVNQLADRLEVPAQLISRISAMLLRTRLLVEVNSRETAFLPGRPLEGIRVADVLEAMRRGVGSQFPTRGDEVRTVVEGQLRRLQQAERDAGERTLLELMTDLGGRSGVGVSSGQGA